MSIDPALTPTEIAALAGPSVPRWFMVYDTANASNIIATAQVNMPGGITYPLPTITVDNTSAGWNSVSIDNTVLIGSTAGGFDRGIYRVRQDGTSSTLEIMAIGANDSGEINISLRNIGISDNDHITVLRRFDIFGAYPRIEYSGIGNDATIFEDWDKTPDTFNQYPPPIVNIVIDGQPANYAKHVYGNTSATFDIDLDITLWATSSSVTWTIFLPSGWTLNSGSLTGSGTTNTINVTVPHSADSYTLIVVASENHSNSFTAYRKVWIKSNTYPPLTPVRIDSDGDDQTGTRVTVTFNSLVDMPTGAMVHLFDMGNWNGSDVATARKCITGYVIRRKETTDIGTANVSLDIVGPSYLMDQIGGQSQIMSAVSGTPLTWQEIVNTLSYLDFIIWWVMWQRGRGLLQMFNYTPFGLDNTSHRMTDWRIDAGSLLSQVQALATRYGGGNFGCDATGEFILARNLSRIPWADRSSVPTRCQIDASIYSQIELDYDEHPTLRRLRGECFVSDGLTTNTPFWCDAPPVPGQGTSEEKLERIIADSEDELLELTGNEYAARNNPYPSGSLTIHKNYAVIKPAQMLPVQTDIPAWLRYDGVAYSALQLPTQVTYTHNADGTIDTQITFETETVGVPATDVPIPVPDPSLYNSPYQFTPFAPIPSWQSSNPNPAGTSAGAKATPKNGNVGFCGTSTHAYVVNNFLGTPQYRDVTPSDLGSFQIYNGAWRVGTTQAYIIASDGTNSAIWYTANITSQTVTWSKGANFAGIYHVISVGTTGKVMAYAPSSSAASSVNITYPVAGSGPSSAAAGATITITSSPDPASPHEQTYGAVFSACTRISVVGYSNYIPFSGGPGTNWWAYLDCDGILHVSGTPPGNEVPTDFPAHVLVSESELNGDASSVFTLQIKIEEIEGTGAANVRYSSDNGATVGSAIDLGSDPIPEGGFDIQHLGTVSIGAAKNQNKIATTLGGSYSDEGSAISGTSAICILIPWYVRNSLTTLNSGSTPEYIYGTAAAVSGSSLWWVVSGSPVDITPMFGGNPGLCVSPFSITTWKGKYIAGIFNFAGQYRVMVSVDAGATWTDAGGTDTAYIRVLRQAGTPGYLVIAGGSSLKLSTTFGNAFNSKARPSSDDLVFFEPIG